MTTLSRAFLLFFFSTVLAFQANSQTLMCGDELNITNESGENNLENYPERPGFEFTAPEAIFQLPINECGEVCFTVSNRVGGDADLFVLTDPTDASSNVLWINGIGGTACFNVTGEQPYYLVIDGLGETIASFDISITCEVLVDPCICGTAEYEDNLVSYWDFENNTDDMQGPNNGTIMGTGFSYVPTPFGDGIKLNGDTHINVGNDASLDFTGKSVTISAWFKVDAFDEDWQALISKGENTNIRIHRNFNTNKLAYNGGIGGDISSINDVNDGLYHHVVAITEQGIGKKLYIDGVLDVTVTSSDIVDGMSDLLIGANPDIASLREWNGVIDELSIWERALCESEVLELFNAEQTLPDLIAGQQEVTPIPTMGEWGLVSLGLLLIIFNIAYFRKRQEEFVFQS